MATINGVGVQWAISSSVVGVTGSIQTRDHEINAESEVIYNQQGEVIGKDYFTKSEAATFTFVVTGAASSATVSFTAPEIGTKLSIADPIYTPIAHTTWLLDNVSTAGTNKGALRVTYKMSYYPYL